MEKNYYELISDSFETEIYHNTRLDKVYMLSFEASCFPDFDLPIYIEVEFFVKGINSKRFPPNSEGFSAIGKNLLRIKNPYQPFHEYIEVVFDELICAVVSLGVHSSLVGYKFQPLFKKIPSNFKDNKFMSDIYESKTFTDYLEILTKNGEVDHVDSFYSDYSKRMKRASEKLLKFIVQVLSLLFKDSGKD